MVQRTKYLGLVAGAMAAFAFGCGGQTTPMDSGTDSGGGGDTQQDVQMPAAHEYVYVMDQLTIEPSDSVDMPHNGFNVDNLFSGPTDPNGCGRPDFFPLYDNDQSCAMVSTDTATLGTCLAMPNTGCVMGTANCTGGVDNQLPTLANTLMLAGNMDIRATIADTVTNNKLSLLVRVSDINDDMNDSDVTVRIYRGYPTFTSGCGSVTSGRAYSVSQSSLTTGATSIDAAQFTFANSSIVNGRLMLNTSMSSMLTLPLPASSNFNLEIVLNGLQARGNISATEFSNATLGGWIDGNQIVMAVMMAFPQYATIVEGAISGLIDIQRVEPSTMMPNCYDSTSNPMWFGGISLGLGMHGVPATIDMTTPIASSAAPGTCGYSAADAGTSG